MFENLKKHRIVLASGSPRRQELLNKLEIPFEVRLKNIAEEYPPTLKGQEITEYLAKLKAAAFRDELKPDEILITADTIVWFDNQTMGKPQSQNHAAEMLLALSGKWHQVISSVCFTTVKTQKLVSDTTQVLFKTLSKNEIDFYLNNYKTADKAGAYGIQDWLGLIAIEKIEGSYYNVMGLPVHLVYKTLIQPKL